MHALAPSAPADVRALLDSLGIDVPVAIGRAAASRSPERVLGRALSLPETVRLAEALGTSALERDSHADLNRELLLDQAAQRLAQLRQRIDRAYAQAFAGKNAVPDAARTHAVLAEHDLGDAPIAARRRAAAALTRGYTELFTHTLAAMQREIDLFKHSVRATLQRACSPRSQLLVLDRLVDAVVTREVRQAHRVLARAYETSCATRIEAAILELPPGCDIDAACALYAPRGVLGRLSNDGRRLILALLDLEWSMVHGLLDALCIEQDHGGEAGR